MSSGESGRPALLDNKEVLCAAPGALGTRKQANAAEAGPWQQATLSHRAWLFHSPTLQVCYEERRNKQFFGNLEQKWQRLCTLSLGRRTSKLPCGPLPVKLPRAQGHLPQALPGGAAQAGQIQICPGLLEPRLPVGVKGKTLQRALLRAGPGPPPLDTVG